MSGVTRHFYHACGLSIASDTAIAGLRPATSHGTADVTIATEGATACAAEHRLYPHTWYVSPDKDPSGQPEMRIEAGQDGYRLAYCDDAAFLVDAGGRHVVARWAASRTDADAASHLSGSVLVFVLRLRGAVPLHASAVASDGRALVFVGDSWSGKSSTAAAFSTLGYSLLSDDIVRIDDRGGDLVAYPCQPRLNVWGDSAAALLGAGDGDAYQKRSIDALDAGHRVQDTPVPIEAVYLLAERGESGRRPVVRDLAPRDALIALVRHTHGGSFLDRGMRARELELIARLVETVPVRELAFGDSLEDLVAGCRTIAVPRPAGPEEPAPHI
jgi:hypothetical protein